jgi:hypothetical protein
MAAYQLLREPDKRDEYDDKHRELLQRWHPANPVVPIRSAVHPVCSRSTTTAAAATAANATAAAFSAAAACNATAAPMAATGRTAWSRTGPGADHRNRAAQLERKGMQKNKEAEHLRDLIGTKASVGSDSWATKMVTVHALNAEAEKFFWRAMKLRKEAVELEKSNGKGKRGREVGQEERAKRCRM